MPCLYADDWPQWQGPDRNAMSKETGLLKEWPKEGLPLAWKTAGLGGGYSGPSIAAGRIFGMSHRGDEEVVWALSEKDGKELWASPLGPAGVQGPPQGKEGPGCTPTTDGERLYVLGVRGDLASLQVEDGKVLWRYDAPANRMGINCSTPIHRDGFVFAASAYGAGGGLPTGDSTCATRTCYFAMTSGPSDAGGCSCGFSWSSPRR